MQLEVRDISNGATLYISILTTGNCTRRFPCSADSPLKSSQCRFRRLNELWKNANRRHGSLEGVTARTCTKPLRQKLNWIARPVKGRKLREKSTALHVTSRHFAGERSTGRGPAPRRLLRPLGGGRSCGAVVGRGYIHPPVLKDRNRISSEEATSLYFIVHTDLVTALSTI